MNPHDLRVDSSAALCRQSQGSVFSMASTRSSPPWADLIRVISQKFYDQRPPESNDEMSLRWQQRDRVHEIINQIALADNTAATLPGIVQQIYDLTRPLVERDLPRTDADFSRLDSELNTFSSMLSSLFQDERMRQILR
jgi:hypothetical protein